MVLVGDGGILFVSQDQAREMSEPMSIACATHVDRAGFPQVRAQKVSMRLFRNTLFWVEYKPYTIQCVQTLLQGHLKLDLRRIGSVLQLLFSGLGV